MARVRAVQARLAVLAAALALAERLEELQAPPELVVQLLELVARATVRPLPQPPRPPPQGR